MTTLQHFESSYADTYITDVLFKSFHDHPPIRATRVTVSIDRVTEPGTPRSVQVRVNVSGERLRQEADGSWTAGGPVVRAYGLGEDEQRYSVCHEAVRDALARHDIDPAHVSGFAFLEPWAEHEQGLDVVSGDMSASFHPSIHRENNLGDN